MKKLNIKIAVENVGGLSNPSKMPGLGISLPATECKVGSKLRKVKGSVCETCYACKGMYVFANVKKALHNRLAKIETPEWEDNMVFLIENKKAIKDTKVFRWHDSGDIQSLAHLVRIANIAKRTPDVRHWIPTKEKGIVAKFLRENELPENLIIRLSGAMIDGAAPKNFPHTSTVTTDLDSATCLAYRTEKTKDGFSMMALEEFKSLPKKHGLDLGHCGDCRKCWEKDVPSVSYHKH